MTLGGIHFTMNHNPQLTKKNIEKVQAFLNMTQEQQYALPLEEYDALVELSQQYADWKKRPGRQSKDKAEEEKSEQAGVHRIRMLAVMQILMRYSNAERGLSLEEIRRHLKEDYQIGIDQQRYRTIPADIRAFLNYSDLFNGYELVEEHGACNRTYFKMVQRPFSERDLKFLLDAVYTSRSISNRAARELVEKIKSLTDVYTRKQLAKGTVYKSESITDNEEVMDNVSEIMLGISQNHTICFDYYGWKLVEEKQGYRVQLEQRNSYREQRFFCHPQALLYRDENYYMIAFMEPVEKEGKSWTGTFRVDKMGKVCAGSKKRRGVLSRKDLEQYQSQVFQAYRTDEVKKYRLCFEESMVNVLVDRFGKNLSVRKVGEHWYETLVDIDKSPMFFGWLASFGERIFIREEENGEQPGKKVQEFRNYLEGITAGYDFLREPLAEQVQKEDNEMQQVTLGFPDNAQWYSRMTQVFFAGNENQFLEAVTRDKKGQVKITVPLCPNPRFFGWLVSQGGAVKILSPAALHKCFSDYLKTF